MYTWNLHSGFSGKNVEKLRTLNHKNFPANPLNNDEGAETTTDAGLVGDLPTCFKFSL